MLKKLLYAATTFPGNCLEATPEVTPDFKHGYRESPLAHTMLWAWNGNVRLLIQTSWR